MTTLCAWCNDMVKTDGQWIQDAEQYDKITGTPGLSHSICHECFDRTQKDIESFQNKYSEADIRIANGGIGGCR